MSSLPPPIHATTTVSSSAAASGSHAHKPKETIQDTIISVVIAFALAFVFRGFVVEAFVIPTGSMAPTLMGAHERVRSKESGYTWPVGPWYSNTSGQPDYKAVQGRAPDAPLQVHDPMTGEMLTLSDVPRRSGDRILVLKYLYMLMEPQRFDVVVFKCPYEPQTNFIKRLVGLPGEEIALVDGDIFTRPAQTLAARMAGAASGAKNPWADSDWKIARKPQLVQEATWQTVFDSDYAPRNSIVTGDHTFSSPWKSDQPGWKLEGRTYEYDGVAATEVSWDSSRLRYRFRPPSPYPPIDDFWEINDRYAYDESPQNAYQRFDYMNRTTVRQLFPVSDIRMSAGVRARSTGLKVQASILARSHEFQMNIEGDQLQLRMKRVDKPEWDVLSQTTIHPIEPGHARNVQFSHADQQLRAWVDGELVASGTYDWTPDERIRMTTLKTLDEVLKIENGVGLGGETVRSRNVFEDRELYRKPRIKWTFEGSPVLLDRVRVDRDLYYQPDLTPGQMPSRGSTPWQPVLLNCDQFFVCGDNSPASHDGRKWEAPDPWVKPIDDSWGVVPRKLMLGKAFFVYYPAPTWVGGRLPVPDFGRMRFIW
ncbi:MAG: signal peptidase I [Pyrinomonadaceae bacterium]|nr:signal peptidase I [Phycisphaerales bacterium]